MVCAKHRFYTLSLAYSNETPTFTSAYQKSPQDLSLAQKRYNVNTNQNTGYSSNSRPTDYIKPSTDTGSFFSRYTGFRYGNSNEHLEPLDQVQDFGSNERVSTFESIPRIQYIPMQLYIPRTNTIEQNPELSASDLSRKVISELTQIQRSKRSRLEEVLNV